MKHLGLSRFAGLIACAALVSGFTDDSSPGVQKPEPQSWPRVAAGPDHSEVNRFVDHLLSQMSLEAKVGQMIQADIASISPQDLQHYRLGSILAGGNAAPDDDQRASPDAWLKLTDAFRQAAVTAADSSSNIHVAIPILFGIDAVHGHAKVRGATIFPHNVGLGAAHDPDLIRRIGQATANEVAATGIDWTFAPTVAVARDVRWGRSYESYSELPDLVASYAAAMVTGLQGRRGTAEFLAQGRTLSSVKHFLGDGGTLAGRDQGETLVSESELREVHAAGYPAAIAAGALIVMASYNSWNGTKMHASHYLLTDVLKERMGFEGFVVGDWNAQEQLPGCTKSSCAAAILAGVDMLMAPDGWKELYQSLLQQAQSGEIAAARIDDAVRRILRVKTIAGLFQDPSPRRMPGGAQTQEVGSAAHRAIAREAVRKSLVLLKNNGQLLPLSPHSHVLVVGAAADDIGTQCGGWTVDWQGADNTNADFPGATSIYAGIEAAVKQAGGSAAWSRDGHFNERPDVAIVVFGERPYAEFEGDRETLAYSQNESNVALLRNLHAAGVPTVAVFLSGRPLWVNREINAADAFVAAWLPGSEAEGIADVLFRSGDGAVPFDFTGRLSFSWPATAMPVVFDAGGVRGAQFANGYGLDYRGTSTLAKLPETARVAAQFAAPAGSLFFAGHPTAPWSLFVADGDAEVHVTTSHQASPHGAVAVKMAPEGALATWNGSHPGAVQITGRAGDFESLARGGGRLDIHYRVDRAPQGRVLVGMQCTEERCAAERGTLFDVTNSLRAAVGDWRTLSIPLSCVNGGTKLATMDAPFVMQASGEFSVTVGEVRVLPEARGGPSTCPPQAKSAL